MTAKTFVDTNILVYAHDLDADEKRQTALTLLTDLWVTGTGIISIQVLHEFYVTITRKISRQVPIHVARGIIENYLAWPLIINDHQTLMHATEIQERHRLSFWDALILAAAYRANAEVLVTEDLNHGLIMEGIRIINPFL